MSERDERREGGEMKDRGRTVNERDERESARLGLGDSQETRVFPMLTQAPNKGYTQAIPRCSPGTLLNHVDYKKTKKHGGTQSTSEEHSHA